jgi:hypothetical protein
MFDDDDGDDVDGDDDNGSAAVVDIPLGWGYDGACLMGCVVERYGVFFFLLMSSYTREMAALFINPNTLSGKCILSRIFDRLMLAGCVPKPSRIYRVLAVVVGAGESGVQ